MEHTGWLHCKVSKGILPDEFAIVVDTAEGKAVSFFMSGTNITFSGGRPGKEDEKDATIPVQVIEQDEKYRLIVLPRETVDGARIAKVEAGMIEDRLVQR